MFTAIIVEDEKPNLELMKVIIGRSGHYEIVGAFASPLDALEALKASDGGQMPDVAFIDVEMPRMNGLELARRIREHCPQTEVVFTTAYKEYAVSAFEVAALDYLLKPVTPAGVQRVTSRLTAKRRPASSEPPAANEPLIRCFGGLEVRGASGSLVRFPTRKAEELFAYLLCHPNRDIGKWLLADMLWPEMSEERVSHNLHNTVYLLKKLLKEHAIEMDIGKTGEGYVLDTGKLLYDVLDFQRGADAPFDEARAERICALYRGPLLEGKPYVWKAAEEQIYSSKYSAIVQRLAQRELDAGRSERAELWLNACIALEPLNEEINELLFEAYARRGSKEKLASSYARFAAAYREELALEPPERMQRKIEAYLDAL
ncbi:response regulator [Paenibacillus athensensis]|uniref:Response regulatory domain-containing protein n=1 Tax=Paenibacillus athensensis TaxID=1967502 RepID=A0A4Y8Q9K4_9BACL|nr:response regulator [Paenibacillus athensensis]MCD1260357.1 response regulator [Paenibacillus athensensis]